MSRLPAAARRLPDRRSAAARAGLVGWLVCVWALLWGDVRPGTLLAGLAVALGVVLLLPLPRVRVRGRLHPLSAAWLVARIGAYFVESSVVIAWLSVRPAAPPPAGVVRVPLAFRSSFTLALAIDSLNLIPGALVVAVDSRGGAVDVHLLDVGPAALAAFEKQVETIQRLFVRALERPEDWREATERTGAAVSGGPGGAS